MTVDALATLPHYLDHLLPVFRALPDDVRGTLFVSQRLAHSGHAPKDAVIGMPPKHADGPVVVAGYQDMLTIRRPVIFVEHGAGQTYLPGNHPSYAGGRGRERAVLFLCPSERVAAANRRRYPRATSVAVGCPKLDAYHADPQPPVEPDLLAVTFHFDAPLVPESRTAQPYFREAVEQLARTRPVLGHAHPRAWNALRRWYRDAGIESTSDPREVFRRAAVLALDNTSLGFEFASLGRPVVLLNQPAYRRGVEHGLRFWSEATIGLQCDSPEDLAQTVASAFLDAPGTAQARESALGRVYAHRDGQASVRAARAVCDLLGATMTAQEAIR